MAISELSLGKQILDKINNHDVYNSRLRLKIQLSNIVGFVVLFMIGSKFNQLILCLIAFVIVFVLTNIFWRFKSAISSSLLFDYFERSADDDGFREFFMGLFNSKDLLTVRDDRVKISHFLYEQDKRYDELKKIETITNGMKGRGE
ncbi:TPA: hypothetical protein M5854_003550 [Escherichia coli]|jgi:hypothetical protein|uniref:hypothetical protein n=1 Tax=Escherichia coli TaxID=562 RepID=UPI00191843D6|nr:hypothetical protein [Escherichia coli]VZR42257.1 Uncharacterised protein [Escherichia coli]HCC5876160.1 hypothetical protein [Escherichia coli]HCC5892384.1 hypothetical protein [Escherichia coli]HCC6889708.1 hypothetical protein [Escherichia coli]HDW1245691.1 hypothetical protein [Escherichia coli]